MVPVGFTADLHNDRDNNNNDCIVLAGTTIRGKGVGAVLGDLPSVPALFLILAVVC